MLKKNPMKTRATKKLQRSRFPKKILFPSKLEIGIKLKKA